MMEAPQLGTVNEGMASLYAKMARVMGSITRIRKDGKVKSNSVNYSYSTASDVADEIRTAMAKEGVAFFIEMCDPVDINDYVWRVPFICTFACSDTGAIVQKQWSTLVVHTNAKYGTFDDKALNKAGTNAQKYFLMKTFIASSGDDVDTDGEHANGADVRKPLPFFAKRGDVQTWLNALYAKYQDETESLTEFANRVVGYLNTASESNFDKLSSFADAYTEQQATDVIRKAIASESKIEGDGTSQPDNPKPQTDGANALDPKATPNEPTTPEKSDGSDSAAGKA